jgi:hypothetical protein
MKNRQYEIEGGEREYETCTRKFRIWKKTAEVVAVRREARRRVPWYTQPPEGVAYPHQDERKDFIQASQYQLRKPTILVPRTSYLPTPPPHTPNPPNPALDTLPPLCILLDTPTANQVDGIKVPSQLLIPRQAMHKTMTSPAQPRHAIQPILCMPAPLPHARMRCFGDEMVVRQGHPVSAAELAGRGARAAPDGGWGGDGGGVGC